MDDMGQVAMRLELHLKRIADAMESLDTTLQRMDERLVVFQAEKRP